MDEVQTTVDGETDSEPKLPRATIVLEVEWDPRTQAHPARWDWPSLLDCYSSVRLLGDVVSQ